MTKRYKAAGLLTICSLLAATCKEINLAGVQKAELNTLITLAVHEKAIIGQKNIVLELSELNDSRCPINVNCIWAGNAKIKLNLIGLNNEKTGLELCLGQCDNRSKHADTVLFQQNNENYKLILTKVEPYPGTANHTSTATLILKTN